jgi:hypothetical protein
MEEIKNAIKIGEHEMVGVIFEAEGIYYMIFALGKKPRHGGNEVKAFKGGDEVQPEVEKIMKELNNGSIAYQRKRLESKEENRSPLKRARKLLMSPRERRKIKKMASDARIFEFFS